MELMTFFRIFTIFLGTILGILSYKIFVLTKGSIRSWIYLVISGFTIAAWAILQTALPDMSLVVNLSSIIGYIIIAIFLPLGFIRLSNNFGIELNWLFTAGFMIPAYCTLWVVLLIVNLIILPYSEIMPVLAGISHILLALMSIYMAYPLYRIFEQTRKWFWGLMFVFSILLGVGIFLGAYFAGACEANPEVSELCEDFSTHYSEVVPLPYLQGLVDFASLYHILLFGALIFASFGLYGTMRNLK